MPIHDWTRVSAGIYHAFHVSWIVEIQNALNNGVLPEDYYALAEQVASDLGPDVLTLQTNGRPGDRPGGTATVPAPPATRFTATAEIDVYALKRKLIAVRHTSEDRVVALIEILSPGNKSNRHAIRGFLDKAISSLIRGLHLLLVDLFPPGPRDPQGIHGALWSEISDEPFSLPADKPLTLASYSSGDTKTAYIEPVAVGDTLPDMSLFLEPDWHVKVPLEVTYQEAWKGVPQRWKRVLEAPAS